MSVVVAAGSPCSLWLETTSIPQQCAAPLSRWSPSSINCAGGRNFNLARQHYQFSFKYCYSRSWINDFGLCRVSNSKNIRKFSLCLCQQLQEGSSDSSSSNDKVPAECARLRGVEAENRRDDEAENRNSHVRRDNPTAGDSQPSFWDLRACHKHLQAVAAKVGDPFRDMMSSAGKKLQNYLDSYKICKSKGRQSEQKPEWGWEYWQEHIAEVQEQENLVSVLKSQLDNAVATEDFLEAARLKSALAAAIAKDMVTEVMMELKKALEEERYPEAAKIRDEAAAGLVGWWVGVAEGENDPYGRIIYISPEHGRFVAKGYSARQLSSSTPGIPLFEVFVRKDGHEAYQQQAIYLQRDRVAAGDSPAGASRPIDVNIIDMNTRVKGGESKEASTVLDVKDKVEDADLIDEGLRHILNFLQDRIPDVKLKVFRVITPNGEDDIPKIVEQLMEEVAGQDMEDEGNSKETDRNSEGELQLEKTLAGESRKPSDASRKEMPVRLVLGGVLQGMGNDRLSQVPIRVPSRIELRSRDSFLFHIEETDTQWKTSMPKELSPSWEVTTIATQASADLMPPDVAKVSKEMGEFLQLAVSQVQKKRGLSKHTSFQRIKVAETNADALNGLYVGAFGPYTSEVVQLRRKYGDWEDDNEVGSKNPVNFFEYVEAVKLTGDLNVPAGQVTFRAKTGMEGRLSHRGIYPEELGVIARYKGQGRLAEPGFQNPQWIEGELVLLDGKGGGQINGANLGFVYSVPERHFLVLFNRLKLKD